MPTVLRGFLLVVFCSMLAQNVDKRRAEIGLRPIAEYMKGFGITWDLEAHIKEQKVEKK